MAALKRFDHVYWIGGGSGAGKSTIAARLRERYGLALYDTDSAMAEHFHRSDPVKAPYLHEFAAMDMDERWLNRSPVSMLETFHWFRGEGFEFILDDLRALPTQPPIVAEGFRLLPDLVRPIARAGHAVWLIPTPTFRAAAFESRGSTWRIAGQTSNPPRALENLLQRDRMFTERIRAQAHHLGLPVIDVDPALTTDELLTRVAQLFEL